MGIKHSSVGAANIGALAQAAVDTIRVPLVVLDENLCVIAANDFFRTICDTGRQPVLGRAVFMLDEGRWNIPELRSFLEDVLARQAPMEVHEIERDIAGNGRCTMLFNARSMFYEQNVNKMVLLAITDVTQQRAAEVELRNLLQQKDVLLQETQHRIGNSLQIIASILLLKASTVQSEETRLHLHDAHGRVMSIAAVQKQLQVSQIGDNVELGSYLPHLCDSLAASMIGDDRPISLKVVATPSPVPSSEAVSIGLIVTELVINALKHAFEQSETDGRINVAYEGFEGRWRLSVCDNGDGTSKLAPMKTRSRGLGTSIVEALAHKLQSHVNIESDAQGYRTTITHGCFE
jgi:two-component sensor histidine kinase